MTTPDPPRQPFAPEVLRALADVLEARRGIKGRSYRAGVAAKLRALADDGLPPGTADSDELRETLALLGRSSVGAAEVTGAILEVAPPAVASVLDTAFAPVGQMRPPVGKPVESIAATELPTAGAQLWRREILRVLAIDPHAATEFAAEVLAPPADPTVAAALVGRLGYRFEEDGFRTLHDSALRDAARGTGSRGSEGFVRRGLSGLVGVGLPDPGEVVLRVPVQAVPRVLGRPELVGRLAGRLVRPGQVQVVVGASGAGKSTLALAVARQAERGGITPLWLPARDLDTLVDGLHRAAAWAGATVGQLQRALSHSAPERAERLWALLDAAPRRWLAVLDGAGPGAVGHPAWVRQSTGGGSVLITTEQGGHSAWAAEVTILRGLDDRAGARMLLDHLVPPGDEVTRRTKARARKISRRLAGSALAIDRVGSALAMPGAPTLAELAAGQVVPRQTLDYVYDVCLQAVPRSAQDKARGSLLVLAMLAPGQSLPLTVVHAAPDLVDRGALQELIKVGLVDELPGGDDGEARIRVHARVAECARADARHTDIDRAAAIRAAAELLHRALQVLDPGRPSVWGRVGMLEPHVAELTEHPGPREHDLSAKVLRMAAAIAVALTHAERRAAAENVLDRALHKLSAVGPLDRARLVAKHTRAWITAADGHGDLLAAEAQLTSLLELQLRRLSTDDPVVLTTRDSLAWLAAEQGRTAEAEKALIAVLADRVRTSGVNHRHTLTTRHRLAWVRSLRGRDHEALPEFAAILYQRQRQLGREHLHVYIAGYRYGWALNRLGQHAAAARHFRAQLDELERVLDRDHPMTLIVRSRLAWSLYDDGAFDEAIAIYRELRDDQEKVLGGDHPRTLATRHDLARIAMRQGRLVEAVAGLREVVARRTDVLGPDHHRTLDSRSTLAWAHLQSGRAALAHREFLAVLADRSRVLGPDHPATLISRHQEAHALIRLGRLGDAEHTLRGLVARQSDLLPTSSRNALHARHSLGYTVALRGRPTEAEALLREVLTDRTRELGANHRETMVTRDVLTWLMGRTGRTVDALEICVQLLADRTTHLGADHPHTLTSRYRKAWLTTIAGGVREGDTQMRALLPDLVRLLGPDHPDTLRCRMALIRAERRRGDLSVALTAVDTLVDDQLRVQGAHAVDTLRTYEERGHILHMLGRRDDARSQLRAVFDIRVRVLGPDHPDTERSDDTLKATD